MIGLALIAYAAALSITDLSDIKNIKPENCTVTRQDIEYSSNLEDGPDIIHIFRSVECRKNHVLTMTEHESYRIDCINQRYKVYRSGFDYDARGKAMHWDGQMSTPLSWTDFTNMRDADDARLTTIACHTN